MKEKIAHLGFVRRIPSFMLVILCQFSSIYPTLGQSNRLFGLSGSEMCEGDSLEVYSLSGDSLWWYAETLDSVLTPRKTLKFNSSTQLFAKTQVPKSFGANLLFNGNFALGDTGFQTSMNYRLEPCQYQSYKLATHTDEGGVCGVPWVGSFAKNYSDSDSLMMLMTKVQYDALVWSQKVPVKKREYYRFSFWVTKSTTSETARMSVSVNGNQISQVLNIWNFRWTNYSYDWYSDENDSALISINSHNACGFGWPMRCDNVWGLDDLSFNMYADSITGNGVLIDSSFIKVFSLPFSHDNVWIVDSLNCQVNLVSLELPSELHEIKWENGDTSNLRIVSKMGLYSFNALNENGCPIEDSVFVGFNELDEPIIQRHGNRVFTSVSAFKFKWEWNGNTIPDSDTNEISFLSTGTYKLTVFDPNGCSRQSEITIGNQLSLPDDYGISRVYPNPITDFLVIESMKDPFAYRICNAQGREVASGQNEGIIDFRHLPAGVYVMILIHDYLPTKQIRVVKN